MVDEINHKKDGSKDNDNREDMKFLNEQHAIKNDCNLFVSNPSFKFNYSYIDVKGEYNDEECIGGSRIFCNEKLDDMMRKRSMLISALVEYNDVLQEKDSMGKIKIKEYWLHKSDE